MQDRNKKIKDLIADCYKKSIAIAKNLMIIPFCIAGAIEQDLKTKNTNHLYPKDGIIFVFDDDKLQSDLNRRIEFLRSKNARNLVERYSDEYIKMVMKKDNYLIGYNQAIPYAVARINDERNRGLLDEFYMPVEKSINDDDTRGYKRG